jgi:uncharacterized protein YndB with AHSA1/START domain
MASSRFVYVTYIRTTPEKLWAALTQPEFTRKYWAGTYQVCDWTLGAAWNIYTPDGRLVDVGRVVEIEPAKRLVLEWAHVFPNELAAEGISFCTYDIEQTLGAVKLTITHTMERPDSKLIDAVSHGWPHLLASLKSLLETGAAIEGSDKWPEHVK